MAKWFDKNTKKLHILKKMSFKNITLLSSFKLKSNLVFRSHCGPDCQFNLVHR